MFWITTTNGRRAAIWYRLTGESHLPVRNPQPRPVATERGMVWVFDLDTAALHPAVLDRIAGYIARRQRIPYLMAKAHVAAGVVIPAGGCTVCAPTQEAAENPTRLRESTPRALYRWPRIRLGVGKHEKSATDRPVRQRLSADA